MLAEGEEGKEDGGERQFLVHNSLYKEPWQQSTMQS